MKVTAMFPKEAAEIIGCDVTTVTRLCRMDKIDAVQVPTNPGDFGYNRYGFVWNISKKSLRRYLKVKKQL